MRELEKIVPDLELCKLIPDEYFKDSVCVWFNEFENDDGWGVHVRGKLSPGELKEQPNCPAPTLAEVMEAIENIPWNSRIAVDFVTCRADWNKKWRIHNGRAGVYGECNSATAALKLWLYLNGIEVNDV